MKIIILSLLYFVICRMILSVTIDVKDNTEKTITPNILESKVNVEIDFDNKIGSFDEKVLYKLEYGDNQILSVKYIKNLPSKNAKYFDVKVDSKDVKIIKYDIVDKDNIKSLYIEFVQEKESKKSLDGNVNIQYKYKMKDLSLIEESKDKIILKDVDFINHNNSNYPTKYNIEITNLPQNMKLELAQLGEERINATNNSKINDSTFTKNQNLKKRSTNSENIIDNDKESDNITLNFVSSMGGNSSPSNKKLRLEFGKTNSEIPEKKSKKSTISAIPGNQSAPPSPTKFSQVKSDGSGVVTKKSYYKSKKESDVWESIIAILLLVCICFLCCNCCSGSANSTAATKNHDGQQDANGDPLYYY